MILKKNITAIFNKRTDGNVKRLSKFIPKEIVLIIVKSQNNPVIIRTK